MATTADQLNQTAATEDSFVAGEAASQTDAGPAKRKSLLPFIAGVSAMVVAVAGGGLYWAYRNSEPQVSPLEPVQHAAGLTVPIEPSTASAPLPSDVPAADPAASTNLLASAAVNVAAGASNAADVVADTFASVRSSINAITGRVAVLEASDKRQDTEIAALRTDVDKVVVEQVAAADKAASAAALAAKRASAAPRRVAVATRRAAPEPKKVVARAPAAPAPVAPRTSSGDASLLAVDTWGGRPSVAVAKSGAGGGFDVRFLNEGETQGNVTLKRADVGSQRATFSTPGGELTLAPKEQ